MKNTLPVCALVVLVGLGVGNFIRAQDPPATKMSKEDQYHLRAVNSELDLIQSQINQVAVQLHAQEKVQEKSALVSKICAASKISAADCVPNTDTGEVTAKPKELPAPVGTPPPPATTPAPPVKK